MKKLFVGVMVIVLFVGVAHATSCIEKYEIAAQQKQDFIDGKGMVASAAGIALTFPLFMIHPAVGVPYFVATATASYLSTVNRPKIALAFLDDYSRPFYRLYRKARRVKSDVSTDEILKIVQDGFASGEFCRDDKLARPKEIRKMVLDSI